MDIRQLTPHFFVSPQIDPQDFADIGRAGIKRVICNRPDAEVPPPYQAAAMTAAAEAAGVELVVCPLSHQSMTPDVIETNYALITENDGPVLAYCASGTRSTIAWAIAASAEMDVDDIVAAARAVGYDLDNLRHVLDATAKS